MKLHDAVRPGRLLLGVVVLAAISGGFTRPARAQYSVAWNTVDGGGTTTMSGGLGGTLRLNGTAGQPDAGVMSGGPYSLKGGFWRGGSASTTAVGDEPGIEAEASLPFRLHRVAPNPVRDVSTVTFDLPRETPVELRVYDVGGRVMRTLVDGRMAAGRHAERWNGRDDSGRPVSAGVFFIRIVAGADHGTQRIAVVR